MASGFNEHDEAFLEMVRNIPTNANEDQVTKLASTFKTIPHRRDVTMFLCGKNATDIPQPKILPISKLCMVATHEKATSNTITLMCGLLKRMTFQRNPESVDGECSAAIAMVSTAGFMRNLQGIFHTYTINVKQASSEAVGLCESVLCLLDALSHASLISAKAIATNSQLLKDILLYMPMSTSADSSSHFVSASASETACGIVHGLARYSVLASTAEDVYKSALQQISIALMGGLKPQLENTKQKGVKENGAVCQAALAYAYVSGKEEISILSQNLELLDLLVWITSCSIMKKQYAGHVWGALGMIQALAAVSLSDANTPRMVEMGLVSLLLHIVCVHFAENKAAVVVSAMLSTANLPQGSLSVTNKLHRKRDDYTGNPAMLTLCLEMIFSLSFTSEGLQQLLHLKETAGSEMDALFLAALEWLPPYEYLTNGTSTRHVRKAIKQAIMGLEFNLKSGESVRDNSRQRLTSVTAKSIKQGTVRGAVAAFSNSKPKELHKGDGTKDHEVKNIFFSVATEDVHTLAKPIIVGLQGSGCRVWIETEHYSDGNGMMEPPSFEVITKAVGQASAFMVCVSRAYKESSSCRAQAEIAKRAQKTIIPLLVDPSYTPNGWLAVFLGTQN
eukprot:m.42085 g.42085  ORF g.42085 m.42085 type:complete len:620 (+) comp9843_c0_seq1:207-2066(+)